MELHELMELIGRAARAGDRIEMLDLLCIDPDDGAEFAFFSCSKCQGTGVTPRGYVANDLRTCMDRIMQQEADGTCAANYPDSLSQSQ